jgi:hypothetical protein
MTTTTGPGLILALDLGKYKSIACPILDERPHLT